MYQFYGSFQANMISELARGGSKDSEPTITAVSHAHAAFSRLLLQGRLRRFWATLRRQPTDAPSLEELRRIVEIDVRYNSSRVPVAIARICGSERRGSGYDGRFLPQAEYLRERWVSIYAALRCDVPLPAVTLVQVGETFYVRDGHSRVSAARALGQQYIDADVQVWAARGVEVQVPTLKLRLATSS